MPYRSVASASVPKRASRGLQTLLTAVTDFAAQRAVLCERIAADPVGTSTDIGALVRDALRGREEAREGAVVLASAIVRMRKAGASLDLDSMRAAAMRRDDAALVSILDDPPAHRALAKGGRLAEVCVPERRAFVASGPHHAKVISVHWLRQLQRAQLPRLLAHPSPVLIGRLLDEPWLELRDVLIIASRRPTSSEIAFELASHDRWIQQLAVREAMVINPFTPTTIVLALLPTVGHSVLRHVAGAGDAHPIACVAASQCLSLRNAI